MAMEDKPQDVAGLEIKPPPSQQASAPDTMPSVEEYVPPTPREQAEAAAARVKEEKVTARPVETREKREVAPPPANAAAMIATVAQKLEDWAQTLAEQLAKALEENVALKAELRQATEELSEVSTQLQAIDYPR